jgi:Asp-tRNA(Asn)/Glu-tRNA(Gln) amidotransferase A subunit family amidase
MNWTIQTAAPLLRTGQLSPVELLEACLGRIAALESRVQAWAFLDAGRARAQAEAAHAEIRRGTYRGALHGIPLGIKDVIDVFDWPTGCGSRRWAHSYARADAPVVSRLRQAGAVFLGKTVTTPYASFDPPPTRNPYDPTRTPGGSSSGSAAAVAAGMCVAALGTQTGGSVARPAGYCGVPSIKPTFGRVSTQGILPLAPSLDHIGIFARCVADLAVVLQAIAGSDQRSRLTLPSVPDFSAKLGQPPELAEFGRLHGFFDERAEPAMLRLMEQVGEQIVKAGGYVWDFVLPTAFVDVLPRHRTIMAVEAAAYHQDRLARHPDDYPPLVRGLIEEGINTPAPEYSQCLVHKEQLTDAVEQLFDGKTVLLTPATTGPAPTADTTGDPAFNSPFSYSGHPTVTIPAGWSDDGLPLSIQLIGQTFEEPELLAVAHWCEGVLGWQARPLLPEV